MLLSRFWYFVLALAAAFAVGAALLAQSVVNTRTDHNLEESLLRDRVVLEAMLRLEARARLDRIAFISVDGTLGGLLRQARDADEKKLRELNAQARQTLHGHVKRMVDAAGATDPDKRGEIEPDIAFALDINGRILAQLGPLEPNPPGSSLATFPLVKRALQGYLRDDVWVYDRRVYRMAARPVIAGSEYVGAILHGYRYDKGIAQKLAANLGNATVVFFQGSSVLTSHISTDTKGGAVPQAAEIVTAAPKKLAEHKGLIELASGGRAMYAPIVGDAATQGVGYAIARPRHVLTRPDEVFSSVSKDDVNALPWPLLGGGVVLLTALGLLFMYLERDRHMKSLTRKTAEIVSGDRDRLIVTEWRGAYRKLADQINQAIDKWVEKAAEAAPGMRRKADLQEILGHTPETTGTPFFGFAADGELSSSETRGAVAKPPPAAPPMPAAPARDKAPVIPTTPNVVPPPTIRSQLTAAAPLPPSPPAQPPAGNGARDEDAHWREVYQQYISTRKQCGEPIDNLTFEKFGVTLKKTRDQLIEKHGAAAVRFTVQVKEGKAALKAQPVK